jgi:transcriptional regulator with XRE-family HTH domain
MQKTAIKQTVDGSAERVSVRRLVSALFRVKRGMTISERLRAVRAAMKVTQDELCARSGIPLATYKKYEGDDRSPGADAISGLVHAGINANWLLTGEGPMLLEELQHLGGAALEAAHAEIGELHARIDTLLEERAPQMKLLREVVVLLEEELERADLDLTPDGKAKVIEILYGYAVKAGALDAHMLHSVLSLAA